MCQFIKAKVRISDGQFLFHVFILIKYNEPFIKYYRNNKIMLKVNKNFQMLIKGQKVPSSNRKSSPVNHRQCPV